MVSGFSIILDLSGMFFWLVSLAISATGTIGTIVSVAFLFHRKRHKPTEVIYPKLWLMASLIVLLFGIIGIALKFQYETLLEYRTTRSMLDSYGVIAQLLLLIATLVVRSRVERKIRGTR